MTKAVQQRIEELRKIISEHDYKYYVLTEPSISDREYDSLMKELEKLEKENPGLITPEQMVLALKKYGTYIGVADDR